LEVIAADHPHNVEDCCWLNTQEDASWKKLLKAFKSAQFSQSDRE